MQLTRSRHNTSVQVTPSSFLSPNLIGPSCRLWLLIISLSFGEATEGFSFQWDTNGNYLGLSTLGVNGASSNGNDVASPGIAVPEPSSYALVSGFLILFVALIKRKRSSY